MSYPTFNSPSLKRAICEIRYLPISDDESSMILSKVSALLLDLYPKVDVSDESPFQIRIGGQSSSRPNNMYQFSSNDHSMIVTIKRDAFSFTLVPTDQTKYSKNFFFDKLVEEWEKVSDKLGINSVSRIGIRFINKLRVDISHSNTEYFTKESLYIPNSGLERGNFFINKNEVELDNNNRFIVTSGSLHIPKVENEKELVLDIDRIIEGANIVSGSGIKPLVLTLHKDLEEVFFTSITEKYRKLMN